MSERVDVLAILDYEIGVIPISTEDYGPQRAQDVQHLLQVRAAVEKMISALARIATDRGMRSDNDGDDVVDRHCDVANEAIRSVAVYGPYLPAEALSDVGSDVAAEMRASIERTGLACSDELEAWAARLTGGDYAR